MSQSVGDYVSGITASATVDTAFDLLHELGVGGGIGVVSPICDRKNPDINQILYLA